MNKNQITTLVKKQIDGIEDKAVVAWLTGHLIDPRPTELHWEYGENEPFSAWIIADTRERNVVIAYCAGGHGAYGDPWGLIFANDVHFGMDCSWYPSLLALVYDGGWVAAPTGWEVP